MAAPSAIWNGLEVAADITYTYGGEPKLLSEIKAVLAGTATRAQVATILMRFVKWFGL